MIKHHDRFIVGESFVACVTVSRPRRSFPLSSSLEKIHSASIERGKRRRVLTLHREHTRVYVERRGRPSNCSRIGERISNEAIPGITMYVREPRNRVGKALSALSGIPCVPGLLYTSRATMEARITSYASDN